MPWAIKKVKNGYAVVKADTGKVITVHPTREKALQHQRALYANVKE
jgi:hypothetical protein